MLRYLQHGNRFFYALNIRVLILLRPECIAKPNLLRLKTAATTQSILIINMVVAVVFNRGLIKLDFATSTKLYKLWKICNFTGENEL